MRINSAWSPSSATAAARRSLCWSFRGPNGAGIPHTRREPANQHAANAPGGAHDPDDVRGGVGQRDPGTGKRSEEARDLLVRLWIGRARHLFFARLVFVERNAQPLRTVRDRYRGRTAEARCWSQLRAFRAWTTRAKRPACHRSTLRRLPRSRSRPGSGSTSQGLPSRRTTDRPSARCRPPRCVRRGAPGRESRCESLPDRRRAGRSEPPGRHSHPPRAPANRRRTSPRREGCRARRTRST